MGVGRRAVLASAAASLATPALLRLARANAAQPSVTLKLHHAFSSVSCLHANFLVPWARRVEEQSAGRIRIDIYPSLALGGQPAELFDQARDRVVDLVWAMPSDTPGRFPKIELFELPFVPPRRALVGCKAIVDFAAGHLTYEFREIHPICFSCADRGVLHSIRPVRTAAEVRGVRLDVSTRFTAAAVALLGGRPIPMPSGQLPLAITRHVVDGCILPWDMVPALKLDTLLNQPDAGVTVGVVVPVDERPAVSAGVLDGVEPGGELGPVLQGLEVRLRVGVVAAGVRTTVRFRDAERRYAALLTLWMFCRSGCGWWPRREICGMSSWRCSGGGRRMTRRR
jgi:hypothetical protein